MIEAWRPVPGWEHRYEVSDAGRVRSRDSHVKAGRGNYGIAVRKGRVLTPVLKKQPRYLAITFADGNRREQWMVHDVVALTFIGPKPLKMHVAHEDGDRFNNAASNLRYTTPQENEADKARHGRVPCGERNNRATATEAQVRALKASALPTAQAARAFGLSEAQVYQIRSGKTWKHVR